MAIRKVTEGISVWNNKMPFPKDCYKLRCIEESFGLSKSSDNPMISRTWEIVSPEVIAIGDKQVTIAGAKIAQFVVTKVKDPETGGWDAEKSETKFGNLRDDLQALGYDGQEIDDENPPLIAANKIVDAIVYGKANQAFKELTSEQRSKGQRVGDPIKGPDGKEIKTYQLQIENILGVSSVETNRAF